MQICKKKEWLMTGILFVALCVLSAVGIWKTVYISADIDESYALTMAARLVNGERLFVDMWEPHQMSAVLYASMVAIYKGITGSMEGALVFMRLLGVFIQGAISIYLFLTLRRDMPVWLSMALSFGYFNFTPKQIQSPEFTLLFYWAMMLLMVFLLRFSRDGKRRYVAFAGVCVSALVLCYPTALLVFCYVLVWFIREQKGKRTWPAVWFAITCLLCGMVFLLYVICRGGGLVVFSNISNILMDASHNQSLIQLLDTHLKGIWEMVKIILPIIVLCHVGRPVLDKKNEKGGRFLSLLLILMAAYALIQFHTITDVNFMIFYPVILQLMLVEWYAYATFQKTKKDRVYFFVSLPLNVIGFISVLLMSNLPTDYSVSFLMPGVILSLWQIYRVYEASGEKGRGWRIMAFCLLICILSQIFVSRICLVRFTATRKKNIFETYYPVEEGVLKGIRLGEFDYNQYETKRELLHKYVEKGESFLYVGADMFLYSELSYGQIATGNTISTPDFSHQLMMYYEKHPEKIPTVVFVDREYGADFSVVLESEPMLSFMEQYFDMDKAISEPAVTVYLR